MLAATQLWIAESERLKESLEYCHLFGEIVHSQRALKYAYLMAMSYQFCSMVQALGKLSNQSLPNFKSLWTDSFRSIFQIGPMLYLIWIYWKWRKCSRLMLSLKGWIGHTQWWMRRDESSVAREAMKWNHLDGIGGRKGRPFHMYRSASRELLLFNFYIFLFIYLCFCY